MTKASPAVTEALALLAKITLEEWDLHVDFDAVGTPVLPVPPRLLRALVDELQQVREQLTTVLNGEARYGGDALREQTARADALQAERDEARGNYMAWREKCDQAAVIIMRMGHESEALTARIEGLREFIEKIATRTTCDEDKSKCESQSGQYCGAHDFWTDEPNLILEARAMLTSSSAETGEQA